MRGPASIPFLDGVARIHAEQRLGRGRLEDRGETVLQQEPQVLRGQQHVPLRADPAQIRRGHDPGEARVAMAFHHAGHQGHAGAVDPLVRQVADRLAGRCNGSNAVALHHDGLRGRPRPSRRPIPAHRLLLFATSLPPALSAGRARRRPEAPNPACRRARPQLSGRTRTPGEAATLLRPAHLSGPAGLARRAAEFSRPEGTHAYPGEHHPSRQCHRA